MDGRTPFDVLLTPHRSFYLEEKQFLSRRSLPADTIVLQPNQVWSPNENHRHTHAAGPEVLYGLFLNDFLCILDETLQAIVLAVQPRCVDPNVTALTHLMRLAPD